MASSSNDIPSEAWEAHKETIWRLRFNESLPLSSNDEGVRTVMQVMSNEHQFEASKWQYEDQLKKWSAAKNLKRKDWEEIFPIYDRLMDQKLAPRIRLAGELLDEKRVKRARTRYFTKKVQESSASAETVEAPSTKNSLWQLEVQEHNGEYAEYSVSHDALAPQSTPSLNTPEPRQDYDERLRSLVHHDASDAQIVPRSTPAMPQSDVSEHSRSFSDFEASDTQTIPSSMASAFLLEGVEPWVSFADNEASLVHQASSIMARGQVQHEMEHTAFQGQTIPHDPALLSSSGSERSALSPMHVDCGPPTPTSGLDPASQMLSPSYYLDDWNAPSPERPTSDFSALVRQGDRMIDFNMRLEYPIDSLIETICSNIQPVSLTPRAFDFQLYKSEYLATRLRSLVLEETLQSISGSGLVPRRTAALSQLPRELLPRMIISAFMNNGAGLGKIPLAVFLQLIRADPEVRAAVNEALTSENSVVGIALADGIFRAALEAGDEEALCTTLQTTQGRKNEIDVNSEVCQLDNSGCTPLLYAIGVSQEGGTTHFGVIRTLLEFGANADPFALRAFKKYLREPSITQGLVTQIEKAFEANHESLPIHVEENEVTLADLERTVRSAFAESHWNKIAGKCRTFRLRLHDTSNQSGHLLKDVATGMDHHSAEKIICDLLETCRSMGCISTCTSEYSPAFEAVLVSAIERNNFRLAKYLLNYIQPTCGGLVIAIRGGHLDTVYLVLQNSTNSPNKARCSLDPSHEWMQGQDCECGTLHRSCEKARQRDKYDTALSQSVWYYMNRECNCLPTTPLAEAIRLQNPELISYLENHCRVLDTIREENANHFEAAFIAAVEIGHISGLQKLLSLNYNEGTMCWAITKAVTNGHAEVVKMLFIHYQSNFQSNLSGSSVRNYISNPVAQELRWICLALEARNRRIVVDLLSNMDFPLSEPRIIVSSQEECFRAIGDIARAAAMWRDESVVGLLLDLGLIVPDVLRLVGYTCSPLTQAIMADDTDAIKQLLEWGIKPHHLNLAIEVGNESHVRLLLQHGATPEGVGYAVKAEKYDLAKFLLENGASPNGLRSATEAENLDMINLLIEHGATPDHEEIDLAIRIGKENGNHSVLRNFLSQGGKPEQYHLDTAVGEEDVDALRLLLAHGCDPASYEAFLRAFESGNDMIQAILSDALSSTYINGEKRFSFKALRIAIRFLDVAVFEQLLELIDITTLWSDYDKRQMLQILHFAIKYAGKGYKNGLHRTDAELNNILTALLKGGISVETISGGKTALLCAIETGSVQLAKMLLSKKSNVNRPATGMLSRTPLQQACEQDSVDMVEMLLDANADVNAPPRPNRGATALQLAAIQGSKRIVWLLIEKGADIHAPAAVIRGRTAIEGAAEHGRLSVLDTLLTEGAAGFSESDIKKAMRLAEQERHRGCVERLRLALVSLGSGSKAGGLLGY